MFMCLGPFQNGFGVAIRNPCPTGEVRDSKSQAEGSRPSLQRAKPTTRSGGLHKRERGSLGIRLVLARGRSPKHVFGTETLRLRRHTALLAFAIRHRPIRTSGTRWGRSDLRRRHFGEAGHIRSLRAGLESRRWRIVLLIVANDESPANILPEVAPALPHSPTRDLAV
jgi:hypothetical protein